MSTQIDLGPVLSIPKGDWNATTTYERLNLVRHNSAAWICNVDTSTGVEPSEDSVDWFLQVKDTSAVSSVNGMRGDVEITTIQTPSNDSDDTSIANTEWVRDRIDETINSTHSYTDNAVNAATTSILDTAAQDASNKATIAINQALAASETKFATKEIVSGLANNISTLIENDAEQDTAITKKLDTSGGTLDGPLFTHVVGALARTVTNSGIYISGGTFAGDGAFIQLFGRDAGGMAELATTAADGTYKHFQVWPDGRIIWDGKYVITSAGGELTGSLKSSANNALNVVRTSGESIAARAEYTPTGDAIRFGIGATGNRGIYDEKTSKWLINFTPNGELASDGRRVDLITASGENFIRYESGVQICWITTPTWDSGGIVWTFPAAFASVPTIIATPESAEAYRVHTASYVEASTTSVTLWHLCQGENGGVANAQVSALAIGRWK